VVLCFVIRNKRTVVGLSTALGVVTVDWVGVGVGGGEVGSLVLIERGSAVPQVVRLVEPERGTEIRTARIVVCKVDALLSGACSGYCVGKSSVYGGKVRAFA
jgi:hypothetical protein